MENMDRNREARVWQRVMGRDNPNMPELRRDNLKPLILEAQENTAAFRALALQLIGKQWEGLRRLETESMRLTWTLRGICALRGESLKLAPLPQPREQPRKLLEKCFRRARNLWEETERRCMDPEFAPVFRALEALTREQCTATAELLGKLES